MSIKLFDLEKNEGIWLSEREVPYLLWANYDIEEKNEDYRGKQKGLCLR